MLLGTRPQGYTYLPPPANDTASVTVKLYNLRDDETEHFNVAPNYPDKVAELKARVSFWSDPKNGYLDTQPNAGVVRDDVLSLPKFHNGTWAPWER